MLVGLALDGWLHARNPLLATHERLFTLSNPGHTLLALGVAATALSVVGLLQLHLAESGSAFWSARGTRATVAGVMALMAAGSAGAIEWANGAAVPGRAMAAAHGGGSNPAPDHADTVFGGSASHRHDAPGRAPTPEEKAAADRLASATEVGVSRFERLQAALDDGYVAITPTALPIVHYLNPRYFNDPNVYVDPNRPESLVYGHSRRGDVLLGAMFLMHQVNTPGPAVGGPITPWHYHDNLCFSAAGMVVGISTTEAGCPVGSQLRRTPEMLHVWVVDNPSGRFSEDMDPAALVALLGHL
jgi:hypothetical protein